MDGFQYEVEIKNGKIVGMLGRTVDYEIAEMDTLVVVDKLTGVVDFYEEREYYIAYKTDKDGQEVVVYVLR